MIDSIVNFYHAIILFAHNYEFYVYWLPAILCVIGYGFRSVNDYYKDLDTRADVIKRKAEYDSKPEASRPIVFYNNYTPSLTVGKVVGRMFVAFIPVINIITTVFRFLPQLGSEVIKAWNRWLNIPFVPKPKI